MEFPKIKTIRYLGSKRKMVNEICSLIIDKVEIGSTIVDLFAGTNCIGYALKGLYKIYSNDVQHYSHAIAKALIANKSFPISKKEAKSDLEQMYLENYQALSEYFNEVIEKESDFIERNSSARMHEYQSFCKEFPYVESPPKSRSYKKLFPLFTKKNLNKHHMNPNEFPYVLFSTYFANSYFGVKQCLQIDSLRFAIEQPESYGEWKKDFYLCALIYAINSCVSSPGHFAQFLKPHSNEVYERIIKERKKDIKLIFYELIEKLSSNILSSAYENLAWCVDYLELFKKTNSEYYQKMNEADLVYADPPYTGDHYSRYYHVLETLVTYDYPEIEGKGRYRKDRFSSNFSIKSKALFEFERLVSSVSSLNIKLLISYNNDGLIPTEQLTKLCNKYFSIVECNNKLYDHSNQGRKESECLKKKNPRREFLIYCDVAK